MKAMLKYGLDVGMNVIHVPGGIFNYQVAHQPGQAKPLQLWTQVDDTKAVVEEHIYVAVTGEELEADKYYQNLGTVLLHGGGIVVHALHIQE